MDLDGMEVAREARPEVATASNRDTGFRSARAVYALGLLTLVYVCLALDRGVISILLGPIKREFALSDTELGFLPLAFSLVFALAGIPFGVIADRISRRWVIVVCMLIFSAMTAVCGLAQSYAALLIARFGVGVGESGCGPAAMSMISDYFPPKQRASALSLYYLATPLGIMLIFLTGSEITAAYGWRATFYVAGIASIVVSLLAFATLREPQRGQAEKGAGKVGTEGRLIPCSTVQAPRFSEFVRFAFSQHSLVHLLAGTTLTALVSATTMIWMTTFLARSHQLPIREAGWIVGVLFGGVSMTGVMAGGLISDWLARRNMVNRVRLIALASLAATPALIATLLYPGVPGMIVCFGIWSFVSNIWYGPAYGLCQTLVHLRMRATLASVMYMMTNLIGVGLGPQIVGVLSDVLAPAVGIESLRYALVIISTLHLWAMLHFLLAGRKLNADLGRVDAHTSL